MRTTLNLGTSLGLALMGLLLSSSAGAAPQKAAAAQKAPDLRATIEATNAKLCAAFAKGDAAELASFYTADAQIFPPGSEPGQGHDAIQKVWQGAIDAGIKDVAITVVEVEGHGDMAHEVGTYMMTGKDGKMADRGKYIVVWKKEKGDKGQWRLHRDIWNTSVAPPAAKPAAAPAAKPATAPKPAPVPKPAPAADPKPATK